MTEQRDGSALLELYADGKPYSPRPEPAPEPIKPRATIRELDL